MNAIKRKYRRVKTLLSVGGWALGTRQMHEMLNNRRSMLRFASTSVKYLTRNGFNGLDLDFQYPGSRGSPGTDKRKYSQLVNVSVAFTIH